MIKCVWCYSRWITKFFFLFYFLLSIKKKHLLNNCRKKPMSNSTDDELLKVRQKYKTTIAWLQCITDFKYSIIWLSLVALIIFCLLVLVLYCLFFSFFLHIFKFKILSFYQFQIDDCIDTWSTRSNTNKRIFLKLLFLFNLVASASDFQRLHNAISTYLT